MFEVIESSVNSRVIYKGQESIVFAYKDKCGAHLLVHPTEEERYAQGDEFDNLIGRLKESRDPLGYESILPALILSYGFELLEFGAPQRVERCSDTEVIRIIYSDDLALEAPLGETIIPPIYSPLI